MHSYKTLSCGRGKWELGMQLACGGLNGADFGLTTHITTCHFIGSPQNVARLENRLFSRLIIPSSKLPSNGKAVSVLLTLTLKFLPAVRYGALYGKIRTFSKLCDDSLIKVP